MAVIQDIAANALLTQTVQMLGFTEPEDIDDRRLRLRIYFFLTENIRIPDQQGDKFVERYLRGPESIWGTVNESIRSLPGMWDVATVPDRFLQYIKNIVGWTSELDSITDPLDPLTLRRLIAASVPFWKRRGPEDTIVDVLRLVTGARIRIWNWFDYRIITDESAFGEDWNGYDPWMVSLPGLPDMDENRYNVRIVDNGTLDRQIVRDLVKLTRPVGERVEISYINFLDVFEIEDDDSQWSTVNVDVADGLMTFSPGGSAQVNVDGSGDWSNYTVVYRTKGANTFQFYWNSSNDYYFVQMDHANNRIRLGRVVVAVQTFLVTVDMATALGVELTDALFYAIRVEVVPEGATNRIRVFFESNLVIDTTDASHTAGSIGLLSGAGSFDLDEAEMFMNPLETDLIDINS